MGPSEAEGPRLRLLGPVSLHVGGSTLPLGGPRLRAILSFLALQAGATVATETLVQAVWGDDEPPSVAKSLSTQISRLRKTVTPLGWTLEHTGHGYRLSAPRDAIDALEFERRALAMGSRRATVAELERVLARWHGEPLDGLDDPPFRAAAVARLTELRARVEVRLVEARLREGDLVVALAELERIVEARPYDEHAWALYMRALAHGGRRRDALEVYQRVRRILVDDLGVEPGAELRRAESEILSGSPPDTWSGSPDANMDVPELVGRIDELDRLARARDGLVHDGLGLVVLSGEPGIGKTALATEFVRRSARTGATTVVGACDRTGAVPLQAILRGLEPVLDVVPLDAAGAPAAAAVDDGSALRDDPQTRARRLVRTIGDVFAGLTERGPVVVVLDDLQWADQLSLAVVDHLVTERRSLPLLLVCIARDDDRDGARRALTLLNGLGRSIAVERVELRRLSADETTALVRSLSTGVSENALDEIAGASGGNPLFASLLAHFVDDLGSVPRALPSELRSVIDERLVPLSSECRSLLLAGAVLGETFSLPDASAICGQPLVTAESSAHEARRAALLTASDGDLAFAHGLIRQALLEQIDTSTCAHLHLAAARLVGSVHPEDVIAIAGHLVLARPLVERDELLEVTSAAARHALALGALETSADFFASALETAEPESPAAAEAAIGLGATGALTGRSGSDWSRLLEDGRSLARRLGRWELVAEAELADTRFGLPPSIPEARAAIERAREVLDHLDPGEKVRRAAMLLWVANNAMSFDTLAAQRALVEAASIDCADPRLPLLVDVTRMRLEDTLGSDPHAMLADALDLQRRALDQHDFANAATAGALTEVARLRLGDTRRGCDVDDYIALARRGGDVRVEAVLGAVRTSFAIATAPMDEADRISLEAQEKTPPVAVAFAAAARLVQLSVIRREQLRLRELEAVIDAVLSVAPHGGLDGLRASVQLELGDAEGARGSLARFREALPTLHRDWGHDAALVFALDVAYDLVEPDGAREMTRRLEGAAGRVLVAVNGLAVFGRADRYLGRAAHLQGDLDGAVDWFVRARELDDASGCSLWAAWARHDEARARFDRDDGDDRAVGLRLADEAAPVARRYDSRRLVQALRRLG